MRIAIIIAAGFAAACALDPDVPHAVRQSEDEHIAVTIPASIQAEHAAIHEALERAMSLPGATGLAARSLSMTLHPHFVREEAIALPPLGLLAPLANRGPLAGVAEILPMTDALRKELPAMLEEHVAIRAAVVRMREAAIADGATAVVELADDLALHARTEEEVLYPAAILVGDVLRIREE